MGYAKPQQTVLDILDDMLRKKELTVKEAGLIMDVFLLPEPSKADPQSRASRVIDIVGIVEGARGEPRGLTKERLEAKLGVKFPEPGIHPDNLHAAIRVIRENTDARNMLPRLKKYYGRPVEFERLMPYLGMLKTLEGSLRRTPEQVMKIFRQISAKPDRFLEIASALNREAIEKERRKVVPISTRKKIIPKKPR